MSAKANRAIARAKKKVRAKPWSKGPVHVKGEVELLRNLLSGPALPIARGPYVMSLRDLIGQTYGAKHVVTTSSGTTAIHVALAAAGVEPGDEVIVPPLTDHGSLIGIFQLNAVAVFCDVVDNGLVMDTDKLETIMTRRTKVIMPAHIAGYPVDMRKLMKIAKKHHITVVEDCAQAHLARIGSTSIGCFGDFGAFSVNESKHIKAGEGGFVLCRRKKDARYADLFTDKCYDREGSGPRTPAFPSLNVRMSEINAALAYQQLKRLPAWIERRNRAGTLIDQTLIRFPLIPHPRPARAYCTYWRSLFSLDSSRTDMTTKEFVSLLNAEGVPCISKPQDFIPDWQIFRSLNKNPSCFPTYRPVTLKRGRYPVDICPVARRMTHNMIAVPVNQYTGSSEIGRLRRALTNIFGSLR